MFYTPLRRAPIKRYAQLRRYMPLKRSTKPILRQKPLARSTKPIKNRSSAGIRRRKAWHQAVRELFNNTCYVCNRWFPDEMLCGHHIKTRGSRPDLELDPQNGIALCQLCHAAIHAGTMSI